MHWRRKQQHTPVFLPGESQGWRSLVGCHLWGRTESDTTEATYQQQQQQQHKYRKTYLSVKPSLNSLGYILCIPRVWPPEKFRGVILGRMWRATLFQWTISLDSYGYVLFYLSSVQFSCSVVSDSLRPHESQHTRPPCPSPVPGVHSDSRPLKPWCHPAISSSVVPFSSCPQSLPASESFPTSQLMEKYFGMRWPKKSQGGPPLEWTGWISLQSKGLSRVFSNTTVQKHQFFGTLPSSQSNSHIHTWPQEKP